jgi:hypothetical protein
MRKERNTAAEATTTSLEPAMILLSDYFTAEQYSPYGMCKVVNEVLRDLGIEKVLPGPMFYTYTKKGYIPCTDKKVARQDAIVWTEGYLTKLVKKVTKVVEVEAPKVSLIKE